MQDRLPERAGGGWQDVRFTDCTIGELDLSSARVARLALDDCRIETLTLSGARLTDVDLRRADFRAVTGVAGLAGSWITEDQLTELAPYLAKHLRSRSGPEQAAQFRPIQQDRCATVSDRTRSALSVPEVTGE